PLDPTTGTGPRDEGDERHVSLGHRALPLIQLLEAAASAKANVMWESP
ncbi:MAG: DUF1840 family protein, partial [Chromatiaceae bacterium]